MTENFSDPRFIRYLPGDLVDLGDRYGLGIIVSVYIIGTKSIGIKILIKARENYYCDIITNIVDNSAHSENILRTVHRKFIPKHYNSPICDESRCPVSEFITGCEGCPIKDQTGFLYTEPEERIYFPLDKVYIPSLHKVEEISAISLNIGIDGYRYTFLPDTKSLTGFPTGLDQIEEYYDECIPDSKLVYHVRRGGIPFAGRFSADGLRLRNRILFYITERDEKNILSICKRCIYDESVCSTCRVKKVKNILCLEKN